MMRTLMAVSLDRTPRLGRIPTIITTTNTTVTIAQMDATSIMPVDRERGVDGICAHRSAAIPDHLIILRGRGLTMVRMPEAQPLARSSSGVTMSARSLADRMVNGSSRAAMTVIRFVRGPDHLPVPSLSGMPTARSKRSRYETPSGRWTGPRLRSWGSFPCGAAIVSPARWLIGQSPDKQRRKRQSTTLSWHALMVTPFAMTSFAVTVRELINNVEALMYTRLAAAYLKKHQLRRGLI
jgi:hypothetical protein